MTAPQTPRRELSQDPARRAARAPSPQGAGPPPPGPETVPATVPARGRPQAPAGEAERAVSVPLAGQAWRNAAKTAKSAHAAGQRRGRFTRAPKKTGPGMIRRPPPDSAA